MQNIWVSKYLVTSMFVKKQATFVSYGKFLSEYQLSSQFSIGSYSIDLYFLENKLTIKFKKHDHMEKDMNYKANQQNFIED